MPVKSLIIRGRFRRLAHHLVDERDDLLVAHAFFAVGKCSEAMIQHIELVLAELETEIFRAFIQGVPAAVLPQH